MLFFGIGWRTKSDGPGNRVIIFLQGCHLRCPWCHSPHSWDTKRAPLLFNNTLCSNCGKCVKACPNGVHQIVEGVHSINRQYCDGCGRCQAVCPNSQPDFPGGALSLPTREMSPEDLFEHVLPQANMYRKDGGIALSGGEALLQTAEVLEFLKLCQAKEIPVCVESSFTLPNEIYTEAAEYVHCWLAGLRDTSFGEEKENVDELVKKNLQTVKRKNNRVIARYPVIRGFTTSQEDWERYATLMLETEITELQILPCNPDTSHYYRLSGIAYSFEPDRIMPTKKQLQDICTYFTQKGFEVTQI